MRKQATETGRMNVHIDTDLGGDPDDACALAMLLGWTGVEITGITTNLDADGRRAGMVSELLKRAGRDTIPVSAGAGASLTTLACYGPKPDDDRYWGGPVAPSPAPPGAALDLLQQSIEAGATVIALGACTNLAMLAVCRPGLLEEVRVVLMGGWVTPPAAGLPDWGPDMDWNVQCDARAAQIVAQTARLTLVTLPVTLQAPLRAAHLPRLRATGPLGALLARQAEAHAQDRDMAALARACAGLPDDLLNFHYDPVTCAVAAGWPGAVVEEMHLQPSLEDGLLRFRPAPAGRALHVVVDIDAEAFHETWFACLETAQHRAPRLQR